MSTRSTGSRVRRRSRPTVGQRARATAPPVFAVLVLALAFVLPDGTDDDRPPGPVSVFRSTYACPGGDGISVTAGQVLRGRAATAQSLPDREPVDDFDDAARWRRATVDTDALVVEQRGQGSGAVGFFTQNAAKAAGGGLVVGSCPPTVDDSWFLGAGSDNKHQSTLALTNLSSSPAVADLSFWGAQGRIDAIDAEGIVVEPYTVRRIDLREFAAGEAELAVRVDRRRGSLAVSALDASTAVFRGTESLAPTDPPKRSQVVAGIPSGSDRRTLFVLNPSTSTARVSVEVIGAKGSFAPKGLESVKVDAGQFKEVAVPQSAGAGHAALRLRSDQPISASVRSASSTTDQAVAEAVPQLDGAAIVPVDLGSDTQAPELVLSAPRRQGVARLEAFDAQMRSLATTDVTIGAGTTKSVDLGSTEVLDAKDVAYVVMRAKGDVIGAATYRQGKQIASLALTAAPVTVLGPQVRPVG
ncbi:DUF5719 family protein [Aeromicrobium sp.]|uniref:DUF5719 family protein n=1 Tax=Aeromicrobium sp. TaxID=1871063 RepID=UPI003D6C2830